MSGLQGHTEAVASISGSICSVSASLSGKCSTPHTSLGIGSSTHIGWAPVQCATNHHNLTFLLVSEPTAMAFPSTAVPPPGSCWRSVRPCSDPVATVNKSRRIAHPNTYQNTCGSQRHECAEELHWTLQEPLSNAVAYRHSTWWNGKKEEPETCHPVSTAM